VSAKAPASPPSCSDSSAANGEALAGTASHDGAWLAVEWSGSWGRDVLADTELPDDLAALTAGFDGRVLLVRRPGRRSAETAVFHARATEEGGGLSRRVHRSGQVDNGIDEPLEGPLVLVCAHGRRDACCARFGPPLFDALSPHVEADRLWQSSHQGGHRFAANVLVLPAGVQLGRVAPADAPRVAALLAENRIPLDLYRGRTLYTPPVQAAEIAIRRKLGLDAVADLRLLAVDGDLVRFATCQGEIGARVTSRPGPEVAASCGAQPEPTVCHTVTVA